MEKKQNGAKPLGFCHRLLNFLAKNLPFYANKQVTMRMKPPVESVQEKSKPSFKDDIVLKGVAEKETESKFELRANEEGEVQLVPPIITIPVEQVDATKDVDVATISGSGKQEDKKRKKYSVRIRSGTQEKGMSKDVKGQDMPAWRPSLGETYDKGDERLKNKESKKSFGPLPSWERNGGDALVPMPEKQVERSISNIDKKVGEFIRERKESFAS